MYSGSIAHPSLPLPLPLRKFPLNLYNSVIFREKRKRTNPLLQLKGEKRDCPKNHKKMYEEEAEADEDEDELKLKKFFHSLSISLY